MKPILYQPTTKDFDNNGIGVLSDAAFCEVTEERNGILELVLDYPINGIHFSEIKQRSIITAKPNPTADAQPFRVYKITKPLNGMVTVYAEHISYDLSGIAVTPFSAGSAAAALQALKTNSVVENPFEFWTDKSTVAEMNVKTPASVRAMLGGVQGSVLDTYGGEYEWDGFTVKLHNERGQNRGVSIRYGKNLTDLEQEENCANVYTAVMPFWADNEGNNVLLQERIVEVSGNFDFVRVLTLDLSNEFDAQPSQDELRDRAQKYIDDNNIGVPKVSLRVSFVPLEQTEENKNIALLERVNLCDTVNVEFEKLGVSATAKVVKTVFDVLLDRYKSVELGDARSNIADTLIKQDQAIKDAPKKAMSIVAQAAENATQIITGNRGGYVVIHSSTGQSQPDEILIMDTPSVETATKVWRWNNSGLGYSETGYNGTYTTALTIDGAFNADFITAGSISANLIKSGLLQSLNEMTTLDMNSGAFTIGQEGGTVCDIDRYGITFYSVDSETGQTHEIIKLTTSKPVGDLNIIEGQIFTEMLEVLKNITIGGNATIDGNATIGGNATINGRLEFYNENETTVILIENVPERGGRLKLYDKDGDGYFQTYIDGDDSRVLEIYGSSGIAFQMGVPTSGNGQFSVWSNGVVKGGIIANSSGAELRLGGGGSSWRMAWNDGESHLQADHHYFLGKSDGLFEYLGSSSASVSEEDYSAFLVVGKPYSNSRQSTIIIPSDLTGYYQIADEDYYLDINYNGSSISKNGGSSGSAILAIYGIR